ncbi:hypothetical protein SCUCBS95973_003904 [Sporothrix curviconia]|uniref:Uncharacterized protein n=1 Tax=Sporothrix curviconia TaxID=1260050 RepID=A0ABP0BJ96_9PEZI
MMPAPSTFIPANRHVGTNGSNGRAMPTDAGLARHSKRKAADTPEGNERLSKRLSLLNLEASGTKMYVPVEAPPANVPAPAPAAAHVNPSAYIPDASIMPVLEEDLLADHSDVPVHVSLPQVQPAAAPQTPATPIRPHDNTADEDMRVDDTKYKVYIYNIDDELADDERSVSSDTDVAADEDTADGSPGKLVFLPDIDKHLKSAARKAALAGHAPGSSTPQKLIVPRPILPNKDGELAGMQLVLYNEPSSLSVPRESDSVRKAILDARARIRERQQEDRSELPTQQPSDQQPDADTSMASTPAGTPPPADSYSDSDAMDID